MKLPEIASPTAGLCKICSGEAPLYGAVDFNKSCEDLHGRRLRPMGMLVYYNRCEVCGFVFTQSFDDWTIDDFNRHIYNAGYIAIDPEYLEVRPARNARAILNLFGDAGADLGILDYGGGKGRMGEILSAQGYRRIETYDPLVPEFTAIPEGSFQIVTCFETMEHVPDPVATIHDIASHMDDQSVLLFSTLMQPADFTQRGLFWWYVAPRNGHISIYSHAAIISLLEMAGLKFATFNDGLHLAYKEIPPFARHLIAG